MKQIESILFDTSKEVAWLIGETRGETETFFPGSNGTVFWNLKENPELLILFRMMPNGGSVVEAEADVGRILPFMGCREDTLIDRLWSNQKTTGVFRKKDDKIIISEMQKISVGDGCYCYGGWMEDEARLCGPQSSSAILFQMAAACIRELPGASVGVMNEGVNGTEETVGLIRRISPKRLLVCGAAEVSDTFLMEQGAGIVVKDGNCLIEKEEYQKLEAAAKMSQRFAGDTKSSLSRLYLAAKTKKMAACYLPVKGYRGKIEEISFQDVEKTQNLVLKYGKTFGIIKEI